MKKQIQIIEHAHDYITFMHDGKEYEILSYDYESIDDLIWSELPASKLIDYDYVNGDEEEQFEIEADMLRDYPELIRYWISTKQDLWTLNNKDDE